MYRVFLLFKKNILIITGYLILSTILNLRLHAEHYDTPGEGNKYSEFLTTWSKDNYNERFDNKGDESLEFGPLARRKGRFYECKDGRSIKDGNESALPIGPLKFYQSHSPRFSYKDDIDLESVESVLLFTKQSAPEIGSGIATSIIDIALRRKIDLNEKESAYIFNKDKTMRIYKDGWNGLPPNRIFIYSNKINGSNKLVKIRFEEYGSPYFTDTQGIEYDIKSIQKSFRLYCPEDAGGLLYRGAALYRFGHLVNKYGERIDKDMPAILVTSTMYLRNENHSEVQLPSF
tara:strand:- start:1086 stop:1952 length:867 start_codon:yes stop_codon:yes gene_type:complete